MLWRAEMRCAMMAATIYGIDDICSCQESEVCLNEGVCIPDMSNSASLSPRVFSITA